MADTEDIVNKDKLDNYVSVLLGLRYMVNGLQDFITEKLRFKQMEIEQKYTLGRCQLNCSRKFGKSFAKWCDTCKHWKLELHLLNRYSKHWDYIKWNKIDSIDFPQSFEEMGKVFVKEFYSVRHGVLKDFSALLSLIRNATLFNVNSQTIDEMLRIRNSYCAHNYSAELHEQDKNICLNVFVRFLKMPEINCTKSGKNALHCIETLRLCHGLPENILQKQEGRLALIDIRNEIHNSSIDRNIIISGGKLDERLQQVTGLLNKRRKYYLYLGPSSKTMKLLVIPLYFFICLSYWYVFYPSAKEIPKGCLSMQFKDNWNIDSLVDFNFYVENLHNQSTVSRDWLFGKIYEELATSEKGVILTAEMGYGKSSIVSNIVCADQSSNWYSIRKNILTYHFCRYDSIRSTNAASFIRNIASAIVNRYPELGNSILSDDIASDILYGLRCSEDPTSCLENAILNPLQNKWKNYQFVILIDALDECNSVDKNNILQLLFKQIDNFPQNVKFIFTSRNIEQVVSKFKALNGIELSSFRNENTNDVAEYIRKNSNVTDSQMNLLTNVSRGNFLHVKLYLESCKKSRNCDFRNIPSSLEKIYQMNLERAFGIESTLFEELMPIFEVLCTMTKPMKEKQIFEIANISSGNKRKIERVIGNELGNFLISTDGHLSFLHKAIADFLTCRSRNHLRFFVHKENGHKLFSAYLLNLPSISESDLVDIVHHVAMSKNEEWQNMLINSYAEKMTNVTKMPLLIYLHQTVRDFNSYTTTTLFLKMTNIRYIDDIDDRHMSAAFIAALHGNEHALRCLLDYGADPYFKVAFSYTNIRRFGTDLVHKCKSIYFCGYNILHIASQNGHIQTVEMLVERYNDKIMSTRNSMNLTAFELAAENGHTVITTYLLNKKTSFANLLSLHHAAENGHSSIVKVLLENGVKDTCLLCNDSIYWIPDMHGRVQQDFEIKNIVMYKNMTMEEKYKFYDDWYLITCDTALNAAVRNGHLKIVDILLNEKTNTLTCNAFDGKNPLMTAVQYNQSTILSHLLKYKADVTAKCRNELYLNKRDMIILGKPERNSLMRIRCTDGMSITHLLAVHWNRDMFSMLNLIKSVNFEDRDNTNSTPLHYAFCHSNNEFIAIAIELNFNLNVLSRNGSTPYHSAAICKSSTLHVLRTKYKRIIPDSKDINGLSILQYGSLITYNHDGIKHSNGAFSILFQTIFDSKHNINNTDVFGRNFLHYAATNGNYYSFISLFGSLSQDDFKMFILQRDKFGQTPVDKLFSSLPKREIIEPFKLPLDCAITSIFYTSCKTNLQKILTPGETFIALVVDYLYREKFFQHFNLTNYIIISMNKRRLYPLLVLKAYAIVEFQNAVSNIPEIVHLLAGFEGPNIADIILSRENVIKCNGQESPLHKIIQNDRGKFWTYSNKKSLSRLLEEHGARKLDFCVDNEGFNVLQRAAMGGNIVAVKYLIEKGMNVAVLSRKGDNLLNLAIVSSPVSEYGSVPNYYHNSTRVFFRQYILETGNETHEYAQEEQENGTVDFSETLGYILKVLFELPNTDLEMLKNQLCRSKKAKLGLMHLAASKGFLQFLKICKHLFGVNILNCRDSNNITLYYLAHIYNQAHVTEWMDSIGVHMDPPPPPEVESLVLYNIIDNYKIRKRFHWSCRLQYSYRYMDVFRLVYKRCSKMNEQYHEYVVLKNPLLLKLSEQHGILSYFNMNYKPKDEFRIHIHNFESCLTQFDRTCSEKVSILQIGLKMDKQLLRYFERSLKKTLVFGLDKIPIFQSLFKSRSVRPNYFESLSFFGLFEDQYRYLELLSVRSDVHYLWIDSCVEKLQKNGVDLKSKAQAFYIALSRDLILNISKILQTFQKDLHDYILYRNYSVENDAQQNVNS
ncbi:Hypothetical predicted protein [Mytilus galloprovincialis]|uniref:Uncharacterized protein n=1 Tax=Mytilus galloprovincialis TaxID=29158 RepID=A0A8B6HRR9_MYTGA|nr:Hypothetical predicted protein [Mytilus galloprovincialis]